MKKRSCIRSLLKAITWRFVASMDTLLIVWFLTGSLSMGAGVSAVEIFTKILIYYIHERLWEQVNVKLDKTKKRRKKRK